MSRRIIYAPEAEAQLIDLYRYIETQASPAIAQKFTEAIVGRCSALAEFPERGTPREDLLSALRTIAFRRRVTIAYRVDTEVVTILGIFYGGQDFEAVFSDDE